MQRILFVIVVVILLNRNEFICGLSTPKEVSNKVQPDGDISDVIYSTDKKASNSNTVLSDDADFYLDNNDNNTNYQFSKEMDMYFYEEFEKLLTEHGVNEETGSQQQPYQDVTTTIADEDYISKGDQLTDVRSTASTDIEITATVQSTESYETNTDDSTTFDSSATITSRQEVLDNATTTTTTSANNISQDNSTTTSGATDESYLQSTVSTNDLKNSSESKDNNTAISSMKPPLSSAGVKISQVEKRLSTIFSGANSESRSGKHNDDKRTKYSSSNMNEIHGFIAEIQQQTPLIVFGCIMSSIIFVALVFFAYRIMNRLNETTTVALIRHSEHPDLLPPHQQYQVQKLLVKQQMQEEKVVQQRLLLQQQKNKPECKKSKKVLKTENEPSPEDGLELQGSLAENSTVKSQEQDDIVEGALKENSNKDSNAQNDKLNSGENENLCALSTSSPLTDENSKKVDIYSSSGNLHRSQCINIIIENGSCLDCIEAVQKRSSEIYIKDNEYATVTFHLGDGVCNDHNHNG